MKRLYKLSYDKSPYWAWDHFGLTSCQDANYGNGSNWFYPFRSGLNGFHARMEGAAYHYGMIHAWLPQQRWPKEFEYHMSTFFFHVDSALECLAFALNALGFGVYPADFLDISDEKALRKVSPDLILEGLSGRRSTVSAKGFERVFPKTRALWGLKTDLMKLVFEQHDVSKHRHMIYEGGSMRADAPAGFWNMVQVDEADASTRMRFFPMHEVILGNDLRKPLEKRRRQNVDEFVYLEDIGCEFLKFISESGRTILEDSLNNIPLNMPNAAG